MNVRSPLWRRFGSVVFLLLAASSSTSVAKWQHFDPPIDRTVIFATKDAMGSKDFCRGVVVGGAIITVHHCVDAARSFLASRQPVVARFFDGRNVPLSLEGAFAGQEAPFAAVNASLGLDFAVLKVETGTETPTIPTEGLATVNRGDVVLLGFNPTTAAKCNIVTICGGEIEIECSPSDRSTWSGSGVWKVAGGKPQLVGLNKSGTVDEADLNGGLSYSRVTTYAAVLGRSSALFPGKESFSGVFAGNPKFAYRWEAGKGRCERSMPGSAMTIEPLLGGRIIHGITAVSNRLVATVDAGNGKLCLLDVEAKSRRLCAPNPSRTNNAINAIVSVGADVYALPEAKNSPAHPGGIGFVRIDGTSNAIAFSPPGHPFAVSSMGSIHAVATSGGDILAGGDDGVCRVDGSACDQVCSNNKDECENHWRVNGLLALPDNVLLAVGRDYRDGKSFPACAWYKKIDSEWRWQANCDRSGPLAAAQTALRSGGREMHLKAPVLIGQRVIAFGSDGAAYWLRRDGSANALPIVGLDDAHVQVEDAVRTVVSLDSDHVAIGSDDGSVRVLQLVDGPSGPFFQAATRWAAYDLSLWITELAAGRNWMVARGQDGVLTRLTWSEPLPRHR